MVSDDQQQYESYPAIICKDRGWGSILDRRLSITFFGQSGHFSSGPPIKQKNHEPLHPFPQGRDRFEHPVQRQEKTGTAPTGPLPGPLPGCLRPAGTSPSGHPRDLLAMTAGSGDFRRAATPWGPCRFLEKFRYLCGKVPATVPGFCLFDEIQRNRGIRSPQIHPDQNGR